MNKKTKDGLAGIGIVIFWLVVWQLAAFFVHNRILIAGPAETLQALVREAVTVSFWKTVVISVSRVTIGFLAAFFPRCAAGEIWQGRDYAAGRLRPRQASDRYASCRPAAYGRAD